jgi:large subunit ribosomal protein L18Ae
MVKKTAGKIEQASLLPRVHHYEIVGRAAPTQKNPVPPIYKMKLFAKNQVLARSKFWYFMKKINKAKKSGGEVLRETELFDNHPTKVSNYGIWLRYESRTDTHNMYKEFRDVTINGAIGQLINEMAGRHRAQASSIQIIKTCKIEDKEAVRRSHVLQMLGATKYPNVRRMPLVKKSMKKTFRATRPTTFAQ